MKPRFWPDTLVGRSLVVLLVGLLASHLVALAIYSGNRLDTLINVGGRVAGERGAAVIQLGEEVPPTERRRTLRALDVPGLRAHWGEAPLVREQADDPLAERVREVLQHRLKVTEIRVALGPPEAPPGLGRGPGPEGEHHHRPGRWHRMWQGGPFGEVVRVSVPLSDGSWLNFIAPMDIAEPLWRPRFILSLLVMAALVAVVGGWALRRATRPIAPIACAAERQGVDLGAGVGDERFPVDLFGRWPL